MTITLDAINEALALDDGPAPFTPHPAATDEQNALLAWAHDHPIDRPTLPVSRGQYRSVNPTTPGSPVRSYSRASSYGEAIDDTTGLEKWRRGLLMAGLVADPNLIAALGNPDADLRGIAQTAMDRGGLTIRAELGTAIHLAAEWADGRLDAEATNNGQSPDEITVFADPLDIFPDPYRPDVESYVAMLAAHGLTPVAVEPTAFTTIPGPGGDEKVIGRIDRVVRCPDGKLRILDIKTGKSAEHIGIAVQLAIYANASHWWTGDDTGWIEADEVDTTTAYVAHMPLGTGTCTLIEVDIAEGWARAQVAAQVRHARRGVAKLFAPAAAPTPIPQTSAVDAPLASATDEGTGPPPPGPVPSPTAHDRGTETTDVPFPSEPPATRDAWITGRITTLVASTAATAKLRELWPADIPRRAPWTDQQIDTVAPILDRIESLVEAPFPHNDPEAVKPRTWVDDACEAIASPAVPASPADNGAEVPTADVAPLMAAYGALPIDRKALVEAWSDQAKNGNRRWGRTSRTSPWTERATALVLAAMRCATHLYDDDEPDTLTRAALELVMSEPLQPTWPTGAVIGTLTLDQAQRLDDIAAAFGAGDQKTAAVLATVVAAA